MAGRGGKLPPLEQGAYLVNDDMLTFLRDHPIDDHASNLGALLAQEIVRNVWPSVEAGELRPVMDRTFPLAEAAAAHTRMEAGEHVGKIVLAI